MRLWLSPNIDDFQLKQFGTFPKKAIVLLNHLVTEVSKTSWQMLFMWINDASGITWKEKLQSTGFILHFLLDSLLHLMIWINIFFFNVYVIVHL
jgi:hypothetical protein